MFFSLVPPRKASAPGTALSRSAALCTVALLAFGVSSAFSQAVQFLPNTTIVAGNGNKAYAGDGGPALSASFGNAVVAPATSIPAEAAIEDPYGNIYVADTGNNVIRRVDAGTGIITTVVGGATATCASASDAIGDGCPATQATLAGPLSVRYFRGDLYIADTGNNYVRVVNGATGIISILAGNGKATIPTAGLDATRTSVRAPQDIAIDAVGNVFISTGGGNPTVIRVDAANATTPSNARAIEIVAGTGTTGVTGDGGPATAALLQTPIGIALDPRGNVYISQAVPNNVRLVTIPPGATTGNISVYVGASGSSSAGSNGDGGPATSAQLFTPQHIAVDASGNLYIADQKNHRIRMVTPVSAGSIISTVAGTGSPANTASGTVSTASALNNPRSVDLSASGDLIISDGFNSEIKVVAPPVNIAATAVGTSATFTASARINSTLTLGPYAVTAGYPAFASGAVTGCTPGGAVAANTICTVPITFTPATAGLIGAPLQLSDSTGRTFLLPLVGLGAAPVASILPGVVAPVAGTGVAGNGGDNAAATAALLNNPTRVAVDGMGNYFIVDSANNEVREVAIDSGVITRIAGTGVAGFSGDGAAATAATLNGPTAVAVDGAGNLFISDTNNNRIRLVSNGVISTFAGTGAAGLSGDGGLAAQATLNAPKGLALTPSGVLFVADSGNNAVRAIGVRSNAINTIAGASGIAGYKGDSAESALALLDAPSGVAVDNGGVVYIADSGNNVIRRVGSGIITTLAGAGTSGFADGGATAAQFTNPTGLAVDSAANVYVADTGNNAIRRIAAGQVVTIAGIGTAGFTGNGALSNAAAFNGPRGISLDAAGNLLIADSGNNTVRGINVTSTGYTFPITSPNTTSAPASFTLTNGGNQPLVIAIVTTPAGFPEQASGSTDCNTAGLSLNAGASCLANFVFSPTAVQTYSGNVVITDNSQNATTATQNIAVSGVGAFLFTASISVPTTAIAGSPQSITVTITNPSATYAGTVHFTSSDPKAILPANYTFTQTDAGKHTFTALVFGTSGIQTITVADAVNPSIAATGSVTVVGGQPATLTIVSGSPQSANISTAYGAPLVVRVSDALGNPDAGVVVTFTAPAAGATATFGAAATLTATTNALGLATTTAPPIANIVTGAFTISATAAGLPAASFQLTNTSSIPAGFNITSNPGAISSLAPGTSAIVTLSITSAGGFNAPIAVACSGAIPTTTCSLSAATVATSGVGTFSSFTLTLATTGPSSASNSRGVGTSIYAGLLLLFTGSLATRRKRLRGVLLVLLCFATLVSLGGCSSNTFSNKTPVGTYNLVVTGTSGSITNSVTIPYYIGGTPQ